MRNIAIGRIPLRVIVDTHLRIPLSAAILRSGPVLIVTLNQDEQKIALLKEKEADVVILTGEKIDLNQVIKLLAERECNEVLVEAGMTLNGALLKADLVDEIILYQAPIFLGKGSRDIVDIQLHTLQEKIVFNREDVRWVGPDLRWTLQLKNKVENTGSGHEKKGR